MGELLRQKVADNSDDPQWKQALAAINKGEPVSNDLCKQVAEEAMKENASQWGYVLEGFPRDADQGQQFEEVFL
jgi:adenylate kinase family enzyme